MVFVSLVLTSFLIVEGRPPELEARRWFNNPVFRLEDDRKVLLFFFTMDKSREGLESLRYMEKINALAKQRDWVVIGLTSASPEEVEGFFRERPVQFTIGAGSRSWRDYEVDRLPKLLVIDRKRAAKESEKPASPYTEVNFEELGGLILPGAQSAPELWEMEAADLVEYIEGDSFGMDRATAVGYLFQQMGKEDFARYADDRAKTETDPWARAKLRYYSEIARGLRADDDGPSPSVRAMNEMTDDPTNEVWAPVRAYRALSESERRAADKVFAQYRSHAGDAPAESIVRRMATEDLWNRCAETDQENVRRMLMRIAGADQDASIRMIACMALGKICPTGDADAADFIESLAAHEPETVRTKPMMEYVAHYIRTGLDDTRTMAPKP